MSLLPFFQWCYQTPVGERIRNSTWLFPVIEAFHLLGLGLTAGAVLLVDLRLFGVGLNRQPVAQLWAGAQTMVDRQPDPDVRVGFSLVPLGIDQVLLQHSVLDKDDVPVPGAAFYVHDSAAA